MSMDREQKEGAEVLLMGNEAIARGALEAGVRVAAGYPGTPSSEIIETLSRFAEAGKLYVEWSTNEKVAMEVAAAASFAGLRSLCVMKQNGVNVASDFLLHLTGSGTRGGMLLVTCDDPGALSSVNEGESRHFARLMEIPLLEPADFQEAKEMTRWAFDPFGGDPEHRHGPQRDPDVACQRERRPRGAAGRQDGRRNSSATARFPIPTAGR